MGFVEGFCGSAGCRVSKGSIGDTAADALLLEPVGLGWHVGHHSLGLRAGLRVGVSI